MKLGCIESPSCSNSFLIKIIGTKGATRFSHRDWIENQPGVVHHYTFSAYPYSIRNAATYFLKDVIKDGKKPLSTLEDAITCQKVVEACERSSDTNKFIVNSFRQIKPDWKYYHNYSDLINDNELDLIFITTPIFSHSEIMKECINNNLSFFVEKISVRLPLESLLITCFKCFGL